MRRIPVIVKTKNKKEKEYITLLFVGYRFLRKGGIETLEAFKVLNQKYDVKLLVASNVPREIRMKYENLGNTEFHENVPREILLKRFYPSSDIFVFPTYYDTFSMVFLEAMAFGCQLLRCGASQHQKL